MLFKITYSNGFIQRKNLVTRTIYNIAIKPHEDNIWDLECQKFGKKKNKNLVRELDKKIKIEENLLKRFGDYFVEDSPLFFAIFSNKLITPYYNEKILIEKLE